MKISLAVDGKEPQFSNVDVSINGIFTGTLRLLHEEVAPFQAIIERGASQAALDESFEQWWADKRDEQDREEPINVG